MNKHFIHYNFVSPRNAKAFQDFKYNDAYNLMFVKFTFKLLQFKSGDRGAVGRNKLIQKL